MRASGAGLTERRHVDLCRTGAALCPWAHR
ncbi:putative leader peptide [Pseudonocardia sp. N23]